MLSIFKPVLPIKTCEKSPPALKFVSLEVNLGDLHSKLQNVQLYS